MSDNQTDEEQLLPEEEAALAEWSGIIDQNVGTNSKELDQSEIDNILGLGNQAGEREYKGIKAMIDKALDSYERLPMLEVVFEKFIRLLSNSLRNLTQDNVDLDIKSIQSLRFGNYINSIPIPTLVSVFRAVEWDHCGLFIADNSLIFSLVNILFGGKKLNRPMKIEGRPYTSIEQSLIIQLTNIVLNDLSQSFATLCDVEFKFERMESDPRFASIARHGDSSILVKIGVDMEDKRGNIEILFPYDALEQIREMLVQVFVGEKFGGDSTWKACLTEKIYTTDLKLEAIIEGKPSVFQDIMQMKVGSTILMENNPEDDIILVCNGVRVATGKLGKVDNKVAIALNSEVKKFDPRDEA